ncbi:ubiquitin carboxyl-terminal hydrolase [Anaeramoeba ignava]|uniref:Ubiquitin carboxyl-terminal hydrolase n=1 Tax=Anaeramoeba ignava TaxID=1746090 RepID=A0A9Q0LBL5_ANAIG|nr:ubiquitin carboxyl-terminal hydrolase [Anaeramoeba ignava]
MSVDRSIKYSYTQGIPYLKNSFIFMIKVILKPGLIPKRRGRKRRIPIIKKIQIYDKDLANHNFQIQDVIQTIPNSGNSCYIASIVQILIRTLARNLLLLRDISEKLWDIFNSNERYIEVQDLRKEVGKHFVNFDNLNQQDLHEFFINLFELLNKETILDIPNQDDLLYHILDLWNKIILIDFFLFFFQKVKCLECKHFSFSFPQETGILLSLESEKDCNLIELLNSFFSKNYFDENNLLFCEHCQKVQSSFQFLIHIPKFFMIFVKRSFYDPILKEERKIWQEYKFQERFNLIIFILLLVLCQTHCHFGDQFITKEKNKKQKGGHFWTEVKDERNAGDFQVFDDSTTLTIPNPCRKSNSYVLMTYQRDDK